MVNTRFNSRLLNHTTLACSALTGRFCMGVVYLFCYFR